MGNPSKDIDNDNAEFQEDLNNKLDKETTEDQQVNSKVTFGKKLVSGDSIIANEFETSGASMRVSQRIVVKAFGNEFNIQNPLEETESLLLTVGHDENGTGEILKPVLGIESAFTFQPVDTDVYASDSLQVPEIVGASDAVSKILRYRFQDSGKPIKIRTVVKNPGAIINQPTDEYDLYGTSEDPYLRFTSVAGITEIVFSSPIPVNVGLTFNSTIETEDGSPLNMLGEQTGSNFSPWGEVVTQLFERTPLDAEDVGLENVDNTSDADKPVSTAQQTALDLKEDKSNKGVIGGYASLDGAGHVPASQLPSYVDEILEFADLASFPVTGETGKIYVALDTNLTYRWSGSAYVELTDTTAVWGNVSGDISNQADLQNALGLKADKTNVLELDNTDAFTPDADYEPATKKYVDDNDVGYVFTSWGANLQNAGRFPRINGTSVGTEIGGLGIDSSAQIPADGTIDVLTYYMATGDNTTVFKIIKNGAVAYTFTCDAAYGRETGIGVPVVVGDNIALEYDAGTAPASSIYSMYIK